MTPGMRITAKTAPGTLAIFAPDTLWRTFTWEGASRSVELMTRVQPFMGHRDLYFPGPDEHWKPHQGISRAVVTEGHMRFADEAAALRWLRDPKGPGRVYRSDGLSLWWGKDLSRKQLSVELWQVYIAGKKPKALPGSRDADLQVSQIKLPSAVSSLVTAVQANDVTSVRRLLKSGAKPDTRTSAGVPVLVVAADNGQTAIVKALLDAKANPNLADEMGEGIPALYAAYSSLDMDMVKLLLARGANPNSTPVRGLQRGNNGLHWGASIGDEELVKLLLRYGARPEQVNAQDNTPLHIAAMMGQTRIARLLLDKKAPVDARDQLGMTPLMHAVRSGQFDLVQLLIQRGANVLARDDMTRRQYMQAGYMGDTGTRQRLEKSGRLKQLREDGLSVLDHTSQLANPALHKYMSQKIVEARAAKVTPTPTAVPKAKKLGN